MGNPYAPPRPDQPGEPAPERPVDGRPTGPQQDHGPRRGPGPQQGPRPHEPRRPPEPADPEAARLATRRGLHFGLLMLAVVLVSALRFPWRTAALAVAVVAIVVGVRAILAARRARVRGAFVPVLGLGVGLAGLIALQTLGTLVAWDVEADYQRCVDGAITVAARERCETDRLQDIEGWVSGITGVPAPAGT